MPKGRPQARLSRPSREMLQVNGRSVEVRMIETGRAMLVVDGTNTRTVVSRTQFGCQSVWWSDLGREGDTLDEVAARLLESHDRREARRYAVPNYAVDDALREEERKSVRDRVARIIPLSRFFKS